MIFRETLSSWPSVAAGSAITEFLDSWSPERPTDVREHAARYPDVADKLLPQLVILEFDCLWESGKGVPVEVQLHRYPELKEDTELKLALIGAELRHMTGEPDVDNYCERFPELDEDLRKLLELRRILGDVSFSHWVQESVSAWSLSEAGRAVSRELPGATSPTVDGRSSVELQDAFEIQRVVGRGAWKAVYEARQNSTRQTVALKLPRPELSEPEQHASDFLREGRTQARLNHQNIPPVYGLQGASGTSPLLVEKLISGARWTALLPHRSLLDNVRILLDVSRAVAYAHRRHCLIHRDLKPDNVMVNDEFGEVYLVDWGLALYVGDGDDDHPAPHVSEAVDTISGTPGYMAPEMALGRTRSCTTRTDVFLLGAVLYEVLTGVPPYSGGELVTVIAAAARGDIVPPRQKAPDRYIPLELNDVALRAMAYDPTDRYADAGELVQALEDFLSHAEAEAQCDRATQRFEQVGAELAQARKGAAPLHAFTARYIEIADQFRQARMMWPSERGSEASEMGLRDVVEGEVSTRFALVGLSLETGDLALADSQLDLIAELPDVSTDALHEARADVDKARRSRNRQRHARVMAAVLSVCLVVAAIGGFYLNHRRAAAELDAAQADTRRRAAEVQALRQHALPMIERAVSAGNDRFHQGAAIYLSEALLHDDRPEIRNRLLEASQLALAPVNTSSRGVYAKKLAFDPDGDWLAAAEPAGGVRIFDAKTRRQLRVLTGHDSNAWFNLPGKADRWWPIVGDFLFRDDVSNELMTAGSDGTIRRWDVMSGRELEVLATHDGDGPPLTAIDVEPGREDASRRRLVTGDGRDGMLTWWSLQPFRKIRAVKAHEPYVRDVQYRPDGRQVASCGADGRVRLWDSDGKALADLPVPAASTPQKDIETTVIRELAYHPDGKMLAAVTSDGRILIWELSTRQIRRTLKVEDTKSLVVHSIAWGADGQLWSTSDDGALRLWNVHAGDLVGVRGRHESDLMGNQAALGLAVHPRRPVVATSGHDCTIRTWNADTGTLLSRLMGPLDRGAAQLQVTAADFDADNNRLVMAGLSRDALLRIWDTDTLREIKRVQTTVQQPVTSQIAPTTVALHPDGEVFVTGERDGRLVVWNIDSGEQQAEMEAHEPVDIPGLPGLSPIAVSNAVWSSSGKLLASSGYDGRLKIWDMDKKETLADWEQQDEQYSLRPYAPGIGTAPHILQFDPTGQFLLAAGRDRIIRIWNWKEQKIVDRLWVPAPDVVTATFSQDGSLLATGSSDGIVIIWSWKQRKPLRSISLASLAPHYAPYVHKLGLQNAAESAEASGRLRERLVVSGLSFSSDRRLLAAALKDGTVRVIDVATSETRHCGGGHEYALASQSFHAVFFSGDGRLFSVGSDGTIRQWDLQPWQEGRSVLDRNLSAFQVTASHDGSEWAAVTTSRQLVRWDRRSRKQLAVANAPPRLSALAYHPDKPLLLAGTPKGQLAILDRTRGAFVQIVPRSAPAASGGAFDDLITSITIQPGGNLFATNGRNGAVDIWDVEQRIHVRTLNAGNQRVHTVAFRPDGRQLAVVDNAGDLYLWNTDGWKKTFTLSGPQQNDRNGGLAYSPDGRLLVQTGLGFHIAVWDARLGQRFATLRGHDPDETNLWNITDARFSPVGDLLATCAKDGTVRLWRRAGKDGFEAAGVFSIRSLKSYRASEPIDLDAAFERLKQLGGGGQQRQQLAMLTAAKEAAGPLPEVDAAPLGLLSLSFSADGKQLVLAGWDAPIYVFEMARFSKAWERDAEKVHQRLRRRMGLRIRRAEDDDQERLVPLRLNHLVKVE